MLRLVKRDYSNFYKFPKLWFLAYSLSPNGYDPADKKQSKLFGPFAPNTYLFPICFRLMNNSLLSSLNSSPGLEKIRIVYNLGKNHHYHFQRSTPYFLYLQVKFHNGINYQDKTEIPLIIESISTFSKVTMSFL